MDMRVCSVIRGTFCLPLGYVTGGRYTWRIHGEMYLHVRGGDVYVVRWVCRSISNYRASPHALPVLPSALILPDSVSVAVCLPSVLTATCPFERSAIRVPRTSSLRWNCCSKAATSRIPRRTAKRRNTSWKSRSRAQTPLFWRCRVRSRPSSG